MLVTEYEIKYDTFVWEDNNEEKIIINQLWIKMIKIQSLPKSRYLHYPAPNGLVGACSSVELNVDFLKWGLVSP